jgi:RNA polymerase sigma factor (sigma-70 family)
MATSQMSEVVQHLRRAVLLREGAGLTDEQLLEDYISHREEAALAALVRRHGPLVWGVCRRVLRNHHDAEDAFQATILVLVRKAASIASRGLLANWLYGVAHQTAMKARATAARRKERERQVTEMPEPAVTEKELWRDLQPLLDEELSRLPDKYRSVIVLCDLEGKTRKEAAQQLGLPEGTVASRLMRARAMLARRLARHGLAVSGGALAAVLSQVAASASVPTTVVSSTIKAAALCAAGQAAATGAISVKVAALTEGVLKTMLLNKPKVVMVVLVVLGMVAFGGGLFTRHMAAAQQDKPPEESKGERAKAREQSKVDEHVEAVKKELQRLQGTWEILSFEIPTGKMDLPADKKLRTLTIDGTKATLRIRKQEIVMTWLIDPTKKPKRLDICYEQRFVEGKIDEAGFERFDGKVGPAIYELEGDSLKECSDDPGEQRPAEFSTPRTTHRSLLILKRIKP